MKKLSRREFLKIAALGTGGLLLEQLLVACGVKPTPVTPSTATSTLTPFNPVSPSDSSAPEAQPTPTSLPPAPDMVVVHGAEPEDMVRRALASFGGMQAFVPSGAIVVIKPNICNAYNTYEYASTTNPWVVGALVKLCLEAGASRVSVFDFPFGGTAENAYLRSGIREQVEAAGGQMETMSRLKYVPTEIPNALVLNKTNAYQDALEADVLINVPIAKQHGSTRLTLGMKNLMGLIQDRNLLHTIGLGKAIADLAGLFRPELTVMDAVRILTANGPTGGNLADVKKMDTIIVSPDIVAVDSYTTGLFGLTPNDIKYIQNAAAAGLGRSDLENLNIEMVEMGG
jgi:uncharacterized protein (DUF362 family)